MQIELWDDEQAVREMNNAVTVGTLRNWRCSRLDGPPFVKLGRLVRYRPEDVRAWVESRMVRPRADGATK